MSFNSGKRIFIPSTPLSVLGTIQPDVLREEMGDLNFVDGLWQRFLWVHLPVTRLPAPGDRLECNIFELLLGIYRRLEQLPAVTYRISAEARKVWTEWHDWCETQKLAEPHPSIRSLYPKARERAARVALVLHIVESVSHDRMPQQEVSVSTFLAAIRFVRWTINQSRLLYAQLGITEHEDSARITRFVERFNHQEWIDPYKVRSWHSSKERPSIEECRSFMRLIVSLGYAQSNGNEGKDYKIIIISNSGQSGQFRRNLYPEQIVPGQNLDNSGQFLANSQTPTMGALPSNGVQNKTFCPDLSTFVQKLSTKTLTQSGFVQLSNFPKNIQVGDRVRYRGKGQNGLFTLKGIRTDLLTVSGINGDWVEVTSPSWVMPQSLPIQDVQKIKGAR